MKKISKIKKYYRVLVAVMFFIPNIVLGQPAAGSGGTGNTPVGSGGTGNTPVGSGSTGPYIFQNPISVNSLPQLINNIFDAVIQIGFVFVILAIIYAGLQFVMAQGNPDKISKAKSVFLWTIVGAVILLGSAAISEVVCNTANQFLTTPIQC